MVTNQEIKEKLLKRRNNTQKMGYLICNRCSIYYELKAGENPEDFVNQCECGGTFEFKKELPKI
jgi:hypothetical protein